MLELNQDNYEIRIHKKPVIDIYLNDHYIYTQGNSVHYSSESSIEYTASYKHTNPLNREDESYKLVEGVIDLIKLIDHPSITIKEKNLEAIFQKKRNAIIRELRELEAGKNQYLMPFIQDNVCPVCRDDMNEKKLEREKKESKNRLRSLSPSSPGPLF